MGQLTVVVLEVVVIVLSSCLGMPAREPLAKKQLLLAKGDEGPKVRGEDGQGRPAGEGAGLHKRSRAQRGRSEGAAAGRVGPHP
jgi:hypothetical protein